MSKRDAGTGSITQLPSGRWRVRVSAAGGKRLGGTCDTEQEARELAAALAHKLAQAKQGPTGSTTLAEYGRALIQQRLADSIGHARSEESFWRWHLEPTPLGQTALRAVTRDLVVAWLDKVRTETVHRVVKGKRIDTGRPLMQSTLDGYLGTVRFVLAAAHARGLASSNPADGLTVVARGARKKRAQRWTYLQPAEIELVTRSELIPVQFRLLYTVAIFTGLRRGELWGLRWADVTLDGPTPQLHVHDSHGSGSTKSGAERYVPLLPRALEALRKIKLLRGSPAPTDYVFATREGKRRGRGDKGAWSRNGPHPGYKVRVGISRRVPFHAFRHTCASGLISGWWGPVWRLEEVRDLLGHASTKETERYAHLQTARLHELAARTTDALPAVSNATPIPLDTPNSVAKNAGESHDTCMSTRCG